MALDGEDLGLLDGTGEAAGGDEGGGGEETFVEDESLALGDEGGGDEGGGEGDEEIDLSADRGGSRAIVKYSPDEVKKGIRELTTANPEFGKKFPNFEKVVTRALYKDARIQALGGLQAVNAIIEAVEVHGGVEGVQQLVDELEEHRSLEKGFEQGDPKVVDGWAKDYPTGFKKLILPAFDKLATIDEEYSDAVVSHLIDKTFARCGVYSAIAAIGEALQTLEAGKDGGATKHYNSLAKFIGDMRGLSSKAKSGAATRDSENNEEREDLAKTKRELVYSSARSEVNPKIMYEMNRLIRQSLPRGTKVKIQQANRLRATIMTETRSRMNTESDFSSNFESLLKAGNKDRLAKFIYTRALKHLPKVVREMLNEFGLMKRAAAGGGSGGGGGNGASARRSENNNGGGNRVVTGRPKTSDIDFTKTDKSYWLANMNGHGTAWLLNGKQAKW